MYDEEKRFLASVEDIADESNKRLLLNEEDALKLKNKFPSIPEEYVSYLQEIGAGTAREQQYYIYDDPALHSVDDRFSWYKPVDFPNKSYLVMGDDFSGNLYALDVQNNYAPVLLDHECMEEFSFDGSIKNFFREMMLLGEDGKDERAG